MVCVTAVYLRDITNMVCSHFECESSKILLFLYYVEISLRAPIALLVHCGSSSQDYCGQAFPLKNCV